MLRNDIRHKSFGRISHKHRRDNSCIEARSKVKLCKLHLKSEISETSVLSKSPKKAEFEFIKIMEMKNKRQNSAKKNFNIPKLPQLQSSKDIRISASRIEAYTERSSRREQDYEAKLTTRSKDRYSDYHNNLGIDKKNLKFLKQMYKNNIRRVRNHQGESSVGKRRRIKYPSVDKKIMNLFTERTFDNYNEKFTRMEESSTDNNDTESRNPHSKMVKVSLKESILSNERVNSLNKEHYRGTRGFDFHESTIEKSRNEYRRNIEFDTESLNLPKFTQERNPKIESLIYDPTNLSLYEKNTRMLKDFFKFKKDEAKNTYLQLLDSGMDKELMATIFKNLFVRQQIEDNESFKTVYGDLTKKVEWKAFQALQKKTEKDMKMKEESLGSYRNPFKQTEGARKLAKKKNKELERASCEIKDMLRNFVNDTGRARRGELKDPKNIRMTSYSNMKQTFQSFYTSGSAVPNNKNYLLSSSRAFAAPSNLNSQRHIKSPQKSRLASPRKSRAASPFSPRRTTLAIPDESIRKDYVPSSPTRRVRKKKKKRRMMELRKIKARETHLIRRNKRLVKDYVKYKKTKRREFLSKEKSKMKKAKITQQLNSSARKQELVQKLQEKATKLEKKQRNLIMKRKLKKEIKSMFIVITVFNYLYELKRLVNYSKAKKIKKKRKKREKRRGLP